jgi:NAD(P)-dependent dehydrogenase (short-subunit alcohol dehydrogenase family)
MIKWTVNDIPDLQGKNIIITGANSGIGFEVAKALVMKNAHVIMGVRNSEKGENAKAEILSYHPQAKIVVKTLDMASLDSVKSFVEEIRLEFSKIHILINNAGVMATPNKLTKDGFELQIGTNHLGHFVLTAKLFPLLRKTDASRIVTVSSIASHNGKIYFDDMNFVKKYHRWKAYQQSKLANLMFAIELDEKLQKSDFKTISLAAHPGVSDTNLFYNLKPNFILKSLGKILMPLIAQSANLGALPVLFAATSPDVQRGGFYGPTGWKEHKGFPGEAYIPEQAKNSMDRDRLWLYSEDLSGVKFHVCQGTGDTETN